MSRILYNTSQLGCAVSLRLCPPGTSCISEPTAGTGWCSEYKKRMSPLSLRLCTALYYNSSKHTQFQLLALILPLPGTTSYSFQMSERITVRPARQSDHDVIKRICLETAYEGKSAAPYLTIPELPALVWTLPYISLPTGFGFVMVEQGVPAGTCTCTASATSIAGDSGAS